MRKHHHLILTMIKNSGRVFGSCRCLIKSSFFFGEQVLIPYLLCRTCRSVNSTRPLAICVMLMKNLSVMPSGLVKKSD